MQNVLEAVANVVKSITDDEPKQPLHIGEAMNCWLYLTAIAEATAAVKTCLNTTTDKELLHALEEGKALCDAQIQRLKQFMEQEGVPLPPLSETKPDSNPNDIPLGVKLTDNEIANFTSVKAAASIVMCASTMAESVRTDVGVLFTQFLSEQLVYATNVKNLMRKRGWLKQPPYYTPPGAPSQNGNRK